MSVVHCYKYPKSLRNMHKLARQKVMTNSRLELARRSWVGHQSQDLNCRLASFHPCANVPQALAHTATASIVKASRCHCCPNRGGLPVHSWP